MLSGAKERIYFDDHRGNVIETIDTSGRQLKADYGNGLYVNYTYTATSPDWTVIEGPTIGRIERKFTEDGKLGGWITPEGEITFTYDAAGRLWKETQPNGRTTQYGYDAAGRVTETKDLTTGATGTKRYNTGGQLQSETDQYGRTTSYTYDRNGRVASTTNALGQTYTYIYSGSSTTIIDPLGRKTTSTNNDYYLPTETTYNNGLKTTVEYLYTNNLQEAKDYPTRITDIGGRVRSYTYDSNGNIKTISDLAGNNYTYNYGDKGVANITSPTGAKISYEYDDKGNLSKLYYGTQLAKQYAYDSEDRIQSVTNASGETITYGYDDKGNIATQTVTNSNGTTTTTTTYDSDGRIATVTNSTGTTKYEYDSNGYVKEITNANGSIIAYERDIQGRITQQTEKANANATGLTTSYTYDILGNLKTVTDSRNRTTIMTYDVVNRLESKTLPNGVKTTYGYDDLDRIVSIVYTKADGTVLASETYTRNPGGEPSKVLREDGSYTLYEYDSAVRLAKESIYNPSNQLIESITYSYDADGKRTKKVDAEGTHNYNYNNNGQLETVNQDGYVYDADGRLHQVTRDGQNLTLDHDAFDRLTQVTNNGETTQYLYDANGNRIGEINGSNVKNYLVAPNLGSGLASTDLVTDENGNVVSDYVYSGSNIIARLDSNGNPIYYLTDSMGSVIGLVDENGNRLSRIIYDGFGEVKSGDDGSSLGGDFRFQGQWLESESGLYYMRARDYDAQTGLFLSRDAVDVQEQSVEAFNPYQFAFNNPLVFSDPTGMFSITEINGTLNLQDALQALKTYSGQQAKDYVKQKLGDAFGEAVSKMFNKFLPRASVGKQFPSLAVGASNLLELSLKNQFCQFAELVPLSDNLRIEPSIDPNGVPLNGGINCAGDEVDDSTQGVGVVLPPGVSPARPEFIFINGDYRRKNPAGYLIGDLKIIQSKAYKAINGTDRRGHRQWIAMTGYARDWQMLPFVSYISLSATGFGEPRAKKVDKEQAAREALSKNVILILVNLYGKTSP